MKIRFQGFFEIICHNPDGSLAWRVYAKNGPTNAGLDYLLGAGFTGVTPITTWYLGLIDLASFTEVKAADTMGSHSTWIENTSYNEAARPTWVATEGGQLVTNSSGATFTMTAAGTIHGCFLTSVSTKGGTTGTLWCTGLLDLDRPVSIGQILTVRYTCSAAGG